MSELSRIIGKRHTPVLGTLANRSNHRGPEAVSVPQFTRPAHWQDVLDLQGLLDPKKRSQRPKVHADAALLRHALARPLPPSATDS